MEINQTTIKTKCDFCGCKNLAKYSVVISNDSKKRMNFCEECLGELYSAYARICVPKSVEAPFKKKKRIV